jgi:flagellar biosynthesis protein FliQ
MEIAILAIIFGSLFGVFYLYYSTRNKERLALIEKGADASIFARGRQHAAPIWKVLVLNLAFLFMGVGLGVLIALILRTYTVMDAEALYPSIIFIMAGLGLYTGFIQTKKLVD